MNYINSPGVVDLVVVVVVEVDVVVGLSPIQRPTDKATIKMEAAATATTT